MSRFIKAELFRLSRSGMYFPLFIVLNLFIIVVPFIFMPEYIHDSFSTNIENFSSSSSLFFPLFDGCFISLIIGNMYKNRTYYYEIMNGTSTHTIILSKLITYTVISVVFIIIPNVVIYSAIGMHNGAGDMQNIWLPIILYSIIGLHVVTNAILISMLIRHIAGGCIVIYVTQMVVSILYQFLMTTYSKTKEVIFDCLISVQFTRLAQSEYSVRFIISVISSFIIEFIILYAVVYKSYKKKNFR